MELENQKIEDLAHRYFAGELSEAEERELSRWLEADDAHKELLARMADEWAVAHVPLFAAERDADFLRSFGALVCPEHVSSGRGRMDFRFIGKIAASALVVLSVGAASYYLGRGAGEKRPMAVAYFETTAPMGARTRVLLPDSSVVWINSGSTLRYSGDFSDDNRRVQLDGEAYFEVTPDSLSPFLVQSKRLDIRVLGTSFNVKAYGADETTDVTLLTGRVNVSLRGEGGGKHDVLLLPDKRLRFNKRDNTVRVSEVHAKDALSWMEGALRFDEQPFASIAEDLERKFNVRIRVESERLRREVFSGSFGKDHTLDEILREVDVEGRYVWSRSGDEVVIRERPLS